MACLWAISQPLHIPLVFRPLQHQEVAVPQREIVEVQLICAVGVRQLVSLSQQQQQKQMIAVVRQRIVVVLLLELRQRVMAVGCYFLAHA